MDEGVCLDLVGALDFITDGAQRPGRWERHATVAHGCAMAGSGGSPDKDLERTTVHQILHGLFLWYRSETVIPFRLPSSSDKRVKSGWW
jgi:hypothetical protein